MGDQAVLLDFTLACLETVAAREGRVWEPLLRDTAALAPEGKTKAWISLVEGPSAILQRHGMALLPAENRLDTQRKLCG